MNTQQRRLLLDKFIDHLESSSHTSEHLIQPQIAEFSFNESELPRLDVVQDLMDYHHDITGTIESTYRQVHDVMVHMRSLKNRKKNVQLTIDAMTACQQLKKLSYGLGNQPKEIHRNLEIYYSMRSKVHHMDKYLERIEEQVAGIEKQYQKTFDSEINKNNSHSIGEISKILELIRAHGAEAARPDTLQQIRDACLASAKRQFGPIEEELFRIPIVGGGEESSYKFFELGKGAMRIVASLAANVKANVVKVRGEEGFAQVLEALFGLMCGGIILELLMRLKRYYQVEKVTIKQSKFSLKEKQFRVLQPYFKEYVAIWNQLQRLRLHLLADVNENCKQKVPFKMAMEAAMNSPQLVDINTNAITLMQASMRFRFDKLLKSDRFVVGICSLEPQFFKEVNEKQLTHCPLMQDFLEETMNRTCEGVEKALETLSTMVISAILNFTHHHLLFEDVFFALNQLFTRSFARLPSSDPRAQLAIILSLNAVAGFPKALRMLLHIKLPQQVPGQRLRAELQEAVNTNEGKVQEVLHKMIERIVEAEWFRQELQRDYEHILERWMGLEGDCFHMLVQSICRVHSSLILETEFNKKYTQVMALNLEKQVRTVISFYERYSHQILQHFKIILDYVEVLQLEQEEHFREIAERFRGTHQEQHLRKIWKLRQ